MDLYLDDVKIGSIANLCTALKIDVNSIPFKKRTKEFEQLVDRDIYGNPKRDDSGRYRTRRKIAGRPEFTVYVPALGHGVVIRIAQTQRKDKDEGFKYTPNLISMDPGEDGSIQVNNDQEFVFWFLHPWCTHSPFHVTGAPAFFEYKDNDANSKKENDHEENLINALGFIVGQHSKSIADLRSIAKGLNMVGVDDMTDEVVKKALRNVAKADPMGFISKVDSREIQFSGKIQDAIDKNILNMQTFNGMTRWYLDKKEILPVPFGTDPVDILKQEMSAKWYLYADEINDLLVGKTVETNLHNPANDEAFVGAESNKISQVAELTPEQRVYLKQMKDDAAYDEKIKALAELDINDPSLHHKKRESYNLNKDAVEAYKSSLVPATPAVAEV